MPRFVILEHRWEGVHWDFMLEYGEILMTWSVDRPILGGMEQLARLRPDHRLAYLDYEGEISGGRGSVVRLDRGVYEPTNWSARFIRVELRGERFLGRVDLEHQVAEDQSEDAPGGGVWLFRFEEGNFDCKTLRVGNLGG